MAVISTAISLEKMEGVARMGDRINVAYLRVSTEAQTEKYGLDMQRQKILDYCEKEGVVIDKWYVDGGYSGSRLDRPEISELLNDAEGGKIGKVFIYKLDRMSRDVIDTLTLLYRTLPKYGVQIVSMTEDLKFENPMDKVVVGVNAIMGQYEREVICMRMRAGMTERVKKGLWMGGGRVPFGYYYDRNDGILHPKEDEAELVRSAYKLYIDGYSCDKISKMLGFKGERIVSQIIKRKSNIGYIEYKGKVYKGLHEAIVDEETFYTAQECMEKRHTNAFVNNDNMLTGLCRCGKCGARMRYMKWGKYHKILCYSQYKSKDYMIKDPNCNNKKVIADIVECNVEDCFKKFLIKIDEKTSDHDKVGLLENSIKKKKEKVKKLYELYVENPTDNLMELIKEGEEDLESLKKQCEDERNKSSDKIKKDMREIRRISDVWGDMTNSEKNKIFKKCIDKIVITDDDIDIHFVF